MEMCLQLCTWDPWECPVEYANGEAIILGFGDGCSWRWELVQYLELNFLYLNECIILKIRLTISCVKPLGCWRSHQALQILKQGC
jgi:hypothetical protein